MKIYRFFLKLPLPEASRLRLHRALLDRQYENEKRQILKAGGTLSDVDENGSWNFEYQLLEENEASFHSRELLRRARRLRLPVPPLYVNGEISEDYQESGVDGRRYYLSLVGEQKLRLSIREEERYRSEKWIRRIPYITALSGLVGMITGLIALLSNLD